MTDIKRSALFSLNDTTGAVAFASALIKAGWEIIGSKETVQLLTEAGLPVTDIAEYTGISRNYGFPPTLHPTVEDALTGGPELRIELVYVLPYPAAKGNDVGGRTLLALAAKGRRIPVMAIEDMALVTREIVRQGDISEDLRSRLIQKTNALIASHYLSLSRGDGSHDGIIGSHALRLANG
jgi:AICAR transformylase/IMP cyclohydrolase PurH